MKRLLRSVLIASTILFILTPTLQAQVHKTGAIFDAAVYAKVPFKSTLTRGLYDIPPRASVKQYAPYAGNQGQYSTCTGWASAYAALTIIYAKLNGMTDRAKITKSAFSPGFAFRSSFTGGNIGCEDGQNPEYVLQSIQKNGVPFFSELDSLCPGTLPLQAFDKARSYTILGFTRIAGPNDLVAVAVEKMKKAISEGKPVLIGMVCDNDPKKGAFGTLTRDFVWIPYKGAEPEEAHAMCVVSYDDTYGGGAFEIENSWGRSFGNDGFFWVRYADFGEWGQQAFELLENPDMVNPAGEQLSGALKIQQSDGHSPAVRWNGSQYVVQEDFPSGTKFRLYLDNNEPAFVYMIGVDSAGKTYRLFPSEDSMSPALTYKRNQVALPDESLFIQTDQNPGEERIIVLYSLRELDLARVEKEIESGKGSLIERLKAALGDKLVPADRVSWEPDKIVFKAKARTNGVVAVLVSINHTP